MARPYSMWTTMVRSTNSSNSWEERAFAEDAAGGSSCVWPPRSYSCSFCKREFRSAQALGGHMNVHRRDRARLKLLSQANNHHHVPTDDDLHRQHFLQNPRNSFDAASEAVPTSFPRVLDLATKRNSYILEDFVSSGGSGSDQSVETKLCVGSSSSSKRAKIAVAKLQFFVSKAKSMEELDLELRLGSDPTKVK